MKEDNKSPFQSKKWIFAFILNLGWLSLLGFGMRNQIDPSVLEAMVYSAAFTQGLYLGGQSAVDSICRYATRKFRGNPIAEILEEGKD